MFPLKASKNRSGITDYVLPRHPDYVVLRADRDGNGRFPGCPDAMKTACGTLVAFKTFRELASCSR
ncbi:hypothetical protein A6X21_17350 [Planctopirus hydrillae]|uniref:Uncharacterized protein n=1 Tax=Planctopirus hydrillae TaxID=1841610 RepID=A0A1C3EMF7_9PLAN|nr:hypothetical protein A6X21_17350 [Planctopirus hydrillae]